jgi:hypothetical protein
MVHHHAAAVVAKAVAIKFMAIATVCGVHNTVHSCTRLAETDLVATRSECVAVGRKMASEVALLFSYTHTVQNKVEIRCYPKGGPAEPKETVKPDAVGTVTAPAAPKVEVKVEKEAQPASYWSWVPSMPSLPSLPGLSWPSWL